MAFAAKHNKTANSTNAFTYEQVNDAPWIKLKQLYEEGHTDAAHAVPVFGCYISHKSRWGAQPALICKGFNVNLPQHMCADVEEILSSDQDINDINAGAVGFYVYSYINKQGGTSYSIRWADLLPF